MPLTPNDTRETSTLVLAGQVMNQILTSWVGEANSSTMNTTVISAPPNKALAGVLNRALTSEIHFDRGSAPSLAYENASLLPAPCTAEPQEKKAKMIRISSTSCMPPGSWPRI